MIWVFPKMVGLPNNNQLVFLLQIIILGCEIGGNHHLRKHPYLYTFRLQHQPTSTKQWRLPSLSPGRPPLIPAKLSQGLSRNTAGRFITKRGENRGGWKKFHRNIFHRKNKTKRVVAPGCPSGTKIGGHLWSIMKGGVSLCGNWIPTCQKGGNILEQHKLLLMAELLDLLS